LEFWINYGLDKDNDFLRDDDECRPFNGTRTLEDVKAGGSPSVFKILIIVFGICLLLINLCAYVALFNQRRRLRAQESLMKRKHIDLEMTTTQENFVPSELVKREDKGKKTLQQNGEEQYDAVKTATAEGIERDDYMQNGWKISRQCSASTMDTHAKIKWWFERDLKERSSPEILQITQFDPTDQKRNPSPRPSISKNHEEQVTSPSFASKQNMAILVPRKKIKKVSVAVDATSTSRIISMFCKHTKDISGDVSNQAPETKMDLKNDALKESGNSVPLLSHPPEMERDPNKCNSPGKACSLPNKTLGGEHCETENDILPQTSSLLPKVKPISSSSGNKNHYIYSKDESSEVTHNNMDTLPTTSPIKSKLHVEKKDVGITVTPDPLEPEDVKAISRDGASNVHEEFSLLNSLERNHRTVPGLSSLEQNVVKMNDKQTDCAQETSSTNAAGARRPSLPPHILWPPNKHKQTEVRQGKNGTERRDHNYKFSRFSRRRRPSTTGRKPSNATPLLPFKKKESLPETIQALPKYKSNTHTEEHPSTPVCRHEASENSTFSVGTPEVHSADNQNKLRHQLAATKIRRKETATEMSPPRQIVIHYKQKSPAKVSVGTSTSSLIQPEGTSTGMVRNVDTKSECMNQKDRDNADDSTSEHRD
jgi:hypothetical protein